jgi:hypothetical protein
LTIIRKIPHLNLLGGLINDHLFTKNGIEEYIKLGDLDNVRGQLLSTLEYNIQTLTQTLDNPVLQFSQALDQISKQDVNKE